MDINYIILAHKGPKQVKKLITAIAGPGVHVYLHLDKKTERAPFEKELKNLAGVCFITEKDSHECGWGQRSLIDATLTAMKLIISHKREGFVVLLSGQDYPVKSQKFINDFLEHNKLTAFIGNNKFPVSFWKGGGMNRIDKYSFFPTKERKDLKEKKDFINVAPITHKEFFSRKNLRQVLNLMKKMPQEAGCLLKKRVWPKGVNPYGGEHYWAMPVFLVKEVLNFLKINKGYYDFHEHTLLVEEIFFQSIVNSMAEANPEIKIKNILTFVDWANPNPTIPAILQAESHFKVISDCEFLFARKFDLEREEKIFDLIDKNLLNAS